jgi:hypothetical protein
MRPKGSIVELVDSGLFILATNPWTSGRLASIARREGYVVKSNVIVRRSPPWSKRRLYLHGMSKRQLERIIDFKETILAARRAGKIGEGRPAPLAIVEKYGRKKPRVYKSKAKPIEQLEAEITKLREALARAPEKVPAVAPAPGIGRVLE